MSTLHSRTTTQKSSSLAALQEAPEFFWISWNKTPQEETQQKEAEETDLQDLPSPPFPKNPTGDGENI